MPVVCATAGTATRAAPRTRPARVGDRMVRHGRTTRLATAQTNARVPSGVSGRAVPGGDGALSMSRALGFGLLGDIRGVIVRRDLLRVSLSIGMLAATIAVACSNSSSGPAVTEDAGNTGSSGSGGSSGSSSGRSLFIVQDLWPELRRDVICRRCLLRFSYGG